MTSATKTAPKRAPSRVNSCLTAPLLHVGRHRPATGFHASCRYGPPRAGRRRLVCPRSSGTRSTQCGMRSGVAQAMLRTRRADQRLRELARLRARLLADREDYLRQLIAQLDVVRPDHAAPPCLSRIGPRHARHSLDLADVNAYALVASGTPFILQEGSRQNGQASAGCGRRQAAPRGIRHAQTPATLQPFTSPRRTGDDSQLIYLMGCLGGDGWRKSSKRRDLARAAHDAPRDAITEIEELDGLPRADAIPLDGRQPLAKVSHAGQEAPQQRARVEGLARRLSGIVARLVVPGAFRLTPGRANCFHD